MANLESDVMRAFVLVTEAIKDQVMSDIQLAAVRGQILSEGKSPPDNLKSLDSLIRNSIDATARNGMRELNAALKPYIRQLSRIQDDKGQ